VLDLFGARGADRDAHPGAGGHHQVALDAGALVAADRLGAGAHDPLALGLPDAERQTLTDHLGDAALHVRAAIAGHLVRAVPADADRLRGADQLVVGSADA